MREVVVAELESPDAVVEAARRVRDLGFVRVEAYTPFPIPALDVALELRRTRLPVLVLLAGAGGLALALGVQWWTNAFDYPLNVGGRPAFSIPTDVPIVFETTVLLASFVAFAGVLVGARLPRLHDPLFDLPGFERTKIDRFWLVVGDVVRERELPELIGALEGAGAVVRRETLEGSLP